MRIGRNASDLAFVLLLVAVAAIAGHHVSSGSLAGKRNDQQAKLTIHGVGLGMTKPFVERLLGAGHSEAYGSTRYPFGWVQYGSNGLVVKVTGSPVEQNGQRILDSSMTKEDCIRRMGPPDTDGQDHWNKGMNRIRYEKLGLNVYYFSTPANNSRTNFGLGYDPIGR